MVKAQVTVDASATADYEPLYDKLKRLGVSTAWYDKARRSSPKNSAAIPLNDDVCRLLSIYFLRKDGSLWTVTGSGVPHIQVRPGSGKELDTTVYVCAHCKKQFLTHTEAIKHYQVKTTKS